MACTKIRILRYEIFVQILDAWHFIKRTWYLESTVNTFFDLQP